jgi:hypothetical protein
MSEETLDRIRGGSPDGWRSAPSAVSPSSGSCRWWLSSSAAGWPTRPCRRRGRRSPSPSRGGKPEAGKTKVKYKDVEIGGHGITLGKDLSHVVVTAELHKDATPI